MESNTFSVHLDTLLLGIDSSYGVLQIALF